MGNTLKALWTVLCVACNLGRCLPHDLTEVAPGAEVRVRGLSLSVKTVEVWGFAVVEHVGDDVGDVGGLDACSNVLAIAATVDSHVVGEVAALGNDLSGSCEASSPCHVRSRVVGAVEVMLKDNLENVSCGSIRCTACGGLIQCCCSRRQHAPQEHALQQLPHQEVLQRQ